MTEYNPWIKKSRISANGVGTSSPPEVLKKSHPIFANLVILKRIFSGFGTSDLLNLRRVCSTWATIISGTERLNSAVVLKLKNTGKVGSANHVDVIGNFLRYQANKKDFGFAPTSLVLNLDRRGSLLCLVRRQWTNAINDLSVSGVERTDWANIIENFIFSFISLKKLRIILNRFEVEPLSVTHGALINAAPSMGGVHGLESFELVHNISHEFEFPFGFGTSFPKLTNYTLTCQGRRPLIDHLNSLWTMVPRGRLKSLNLRVRKILEDDVFIAATAEEELQTSIVAVLNHHRVEKLRLESRFPFQMTKHILENLTAPIHHLTLYVSMRRGTSELGFFEDVLPALCQRSIGNTLRTLDLRIQQDGDWRRQVNGDDPWSGFRNRGRTINLNIRDLRISRASGKHSGRIPGLAPVPDVFQELYSRIPNLFPNVEVLSVFVPTVKSWRALVGSCSQMTDLRTLNVYSAMNRKSMNNYVLLGMDPLQYPIHRVGFEADYQGLCSLRGVEYINFYAAKGLDTSWVHWPLVHRRMTALKGLRFDTPIPWRNERSTMSVCQNTSARILKKFKGIEAGADDFFTEFCNLKV